MLAVPTPIIFVVSLSAAGLLLWRRGILTDVDQAARGANGWLAAGAFLLYLVGLGLQAARWHVLAVLVKGRSDAARAAEAFLTSLVVNYAIPIGLAVPARAALTKRALDLSARETGSLALWEVACDVGILGLGSLGWLLLSSAARTEAARFAPAATSPVLLAVTGIVVILFMTVLARLPRLGRLRHRGAVTMADLLSYPRQRPDTAVHVLALTLAYWFVQGSVFWMLLNAVDVDPGVRLLFGLLSLPVLIGMLSPIPGGAGVREALMVVVAHVHDVDSTAVLLAALTYRLSLFAGVPILYAGVRVWLVRRRALARHRSPA